jgi:hypothetical protein
MKAILVSFLLIASVYCFGQNIIQRTATIDSSLLSNMRSSLNSSSPYFDEILSNSSFIRKSINNQTFEPIDEGEVGLLTYRRPYYISGFWTSDSLVIYDAVYGVPLLQGDKLDLLNDFITAMPINDIMSYFSDTTVPPERRALDQVYVMNITDLMLDYLWYVDTTYITQALTNILYLKGKMNWSTFISRAMV